MENKYQGQLHVFGGYFTNVYIGETLLTGYIWITKEQYYDHQWFGHTEDYFQSMELTFLWNSLDRTAQESLTEETLESWNTFYKNLFVNFHEDTNKYPYEILTTYGVDTIMTFTTPRQQEVFNDLLTLGKYLETKTGHKNLLSKFYDILTPEIIGTLDNTKWRPTTFNRNLYPTIALATN